LPLVSKDMARTMTCVGGGGVALVEGGWKCARAEGPRAGVSACCGDHTLGAA